MGPSNEPERSPSESDDVLAKDKLYEGARHELVNETVREVVTADVIAWLDDVIAAG